MTEISPQPQRRSSSESSEEYPSGSPIYVSGLFGYVIGVLWIGVLRHRIDTQPEVRLRVGAFDVGVLVFSAAAIFLASVHGKCLRHTEDVDVVFTKKNSSLLTLECGQWIRMLCDSSNLHKQKLVEPIPLASKMATVKKVGQKNGEVGLLVEYLFCDYVILRVKSIRQVRLFYVSGLLNRRTWQIVFTWLWGWQPLRQSKRQSLPPTVFLKTTLT